MGAKPNYFTHRLRALSGDFGRQVLGDREVKTLLTVLSIEDGPQALSEKLVVDLGYGDQHMKKAFEGRGANYRGIDINDCNLETEKFPIHDETCHIAVSMAIIEPLRDPGHFLAEINRVLSWGGLVDGNPSQ